MTEMYLTVLLHDREHPAPGGHPENPGRLKPAIEALRGSDSPIAFTNLAPVAREPKSIRAVHTPQYLDQLRMLAEQGGGHADPDTYVSPGSFAAAVEVSNAVVTAVEAVCNKKGLSKALVIGRPPGHHAESSAAMGFCLINHIAVAAQFAIDHMGAERVAIVDFDLHHGNGTQEIFYDRDDVLYISTHQYPFYPGTGAASERGDGEGVGYTINFPLPSGTDDDRLTDIYQNELIPALDDYGPGLILVSAGFDGHRDDPLGLLAFTESGFEMIGESLSRAADRLCSGRLVTYVEGGYNPTANRNSLLAYLKGIDTNG